MSEPRERDLRAVEREWADAFAAPQPMSVEGFDRLLADMGYRSPDSAPVTLSTEGVLLEAAYDSLDSAYDEVAVERAANARLCRSNENLRAKLRAAKWLLAIAWIAAAFCAGALVRIVGGN